MADPIAPQTVLARWGLEEARVSPMAGGLINRTWRVDAAVGRFVLQRLSGIFDPRIHHNIAAVTRHLATHGIRTLELVSTSDGALWVEEEGAWRLYRHVDGVTHDVVPSLDAARSGGRLLGTFHATLRDLQHEFVGMRLGVHDTAKHLAALHAALDDHRGHRLHDAVGSLASEVLESANALRPLSPHATLIGHGDPKISNVLFSTTQPSDAVCLVDLDTVGPAHLAHELGDLWRSWCNRAREDEPVPRLDLDVMRASWAGWSEGLRREPSHEEREAALLGPEWISLELAARFAADALVETYFGWDETRFPSRGEHNLARARGQWALHRAIVDCRAERTALLEGHLD